MEMQHHFTVPAPVDVAWSALIDVERVAPCMPGATLTKAEGDEFAGSVKVKLGPISLLYKGTGTFTEVDESARRVVIDASGKDSRGNGTAAATVTAVLTDQGDSTSVTVDTDLKVTGKPAQFGRGLITEVGGKILGQFADCLANQLAGTAAAGPGTPQAAAPETPSENTRNEKPHAAGLGVHGNGEQSASQESADDKRTGAMRIDEPSYDSEPEPIDLLGTVGTPVLKRLAPVVALGVVIAVVVGLKRRCRKR